MYFYDWNISKYILFPDVFFYGLVWNLWEPPYPHLENWNCLRNSSLGIYIIYSFLDRSPFLSPLPLYWFTFQSTNLNHTKSPRNGTSNPSPSGPRSMETPLRPHSQTLKIQNLKTQNLKTQNLKTQNSKTQNLKTQKPWKLENSKP